MRYELCTYEDIKPVQKHNVKKNKQKQTKTNKQKTEAKSCTVVVVIVVVIVAVAAAGAWKRTEWLHTERDRSKCVGVQLIK